MRRGARVDVPQEYTEDVLVLFRAMDVRVDMIEFEAAENATDTVHISLETDQPLPDRLVLAITQESPTRLVMELEPHPA